MLNRLLLITADKDISKKIKKTIENIFPEKLQIDEVHAGKKVIKNVSEKEYDLIIIDNDVKNINSFDITKQICEIYNYEFIPVLLLIDFNKSSLDESGIIYSGLTDFIQKPVVDIELKLRVKHLVQTKKKIENFKQSLIISGSLIDSLETNLIDIEKLKNQLEQEMEKLNEIVHNRYEIFATTLHDLKSPFSSIIGNCQLLTKGYVGDLNEEQLKAVNTIENSSKRLLNMVNDYLDTSKLQAGKMELFLNKVAVSFLLELAVKEILPLTREKRISVETICEPSIPQVHVDIEKIIRVLNNLLTNAIKNNVENGNITINAKDNKNGYVLISIKDTGSGIKKEYLDKIFDKYEQGAKRIEGTGLGLTICKNIIDLHNGSICVESKENEGSTFSFTIPIDFPIKNAELLT